MSAERFYIIKDGEREGPFDESYVRFLLENDELGFEDFCETADGQRVRLGTLYEPVDEEVPDGGRSSGSQGEGNGARRRRGARCRAKSCTSGTRPT